jgi:hypothetical protein
LEAAGETSKPGADAADASGATTLTASEVDQRLATALPRVQFVKMPLARFVGFLSDLINLPIAIDDEGLARAHTQRQVPVTVQLTDATAREALRAATAPLGLACVIRGDKLVITAARQKPAESP